jgi:hypothetical protein
MQSEINIRVGNKSPKIYFAELEKQVAENDSIYGGITDKDDLMRNLRMNCIPEDIFKMDIDDYDDFLIKRRRLMAKKIKDYYYSL